jgi:hypothetical protein
MKWILWGAVVTVLIIIGFIGEHIRDNSPKYNPEIGNLSSSGVSNHSKCKVSSNEDPNGVVFLYTRPEPIGKNDRLEYGVSLQTNGELYRLAVMIRFLRNASKATDDLKIQFSNGKSSSLRITMNELTYGNGSEVLLAVYDLTDSDIDRINQGDIKSINFKTEDGYLNIITIANKGSLLKQHYECLQKEL